MALPTSLIVAGGMLKAFGQLSESRDRADAFGDLADQIMQQGIQRARDFERGSSALRASGTAARAASGVQLNTGTALMVDENIVKEIAQGRARILEDARRRAAEARRAERRSKRAGRFGAAGTLLTTAGSFI